MRQQVFGYSPLEARSFWGQDILDSPEHKWQHLTHMTDDHPQAWMSVKSPSENHSQHMYGELGMPAPSSNAQHVAQRKAFIVCLANCFRGLGWMKIQWGIQLLGSLKQGLESGLVEKLALRESADHCTD
jgi:hypothetical protein